MNSIGPSPSPTPSAGEGTFSASSTDSGSPPATGRGSDIVCLQYYLVTDADHETGCEGIEARFRIGSQALRELNPHINEDCTNLIPGIYYCVARKCPLFS